MRREQAGGVRERAGEPVGPLSRFLLYPLLRLLRLLKRSVERLILSIENVSPHDMIEEELQHLIDEGRLEGVMDEGDEELINSVIEFGDTRVREVMVPRIDMVALEVGTPLAEVLETVVRVGHTRLPVYRERIDDVVGVLHAKDLLKVWQLGREGIATEEILRPVLFVPENQMISILLRDIKKNRTHLAVVIDEFGGTAGLITLEDIVEEIIGEVADEFDSEELSPVRRTPQGWDVDPRTDVKDLAEEIGLPEAAVGGRESETAGGLLSEVLGRLPRLAEEVSIGGFIFKVTEMDGKRVLKMRVSKEDL